MQGVESVLRSVLLLLDDPEIGLDPDGTSNDQALDAEYADVEQATELLVADGVKKKKKKKKRSLASVRVLSFFTFNSSP